MKKTQRISFRLVAYTDAAGKYSPDTYRGGNEDNFYVDDDLTDSVINRSPQDETIQLGSLGMLMVVADGMGGMNAGEVASQVAVDTVKDAFKSNLLSSSVVASAQSRQKYMEQTIRTADKNIKLEARKDKSREGMGSTIIIAWLFGDELTISWCGDSRAYLFNEKSGIRLLSQDHSYVQELVNKGLLTYDQTFDHPQNNIVTRSLGDPTKDAKPDSKTIKIGKGDIVLLCSDGLSGVLRDRKTYDSNAQPYPEENIEDIIRANIDSMKECRKALWEAAERCGWYDNVTAILCQITDGPESLWATSPIGNNGGGKTNKTSSTILRILIGVIFCCAIIVAFFLGKYCNNGNSDDYAIVDTTIADTAKSEMNTEKQDSEEQQVEGATHTSPEQEPVSSESNNILKRSKDVLGTPNETVHEPEVPTTHEGELTEKTREKSQQKGSDKINEVPTSQMDVQNADNKNTDSKSSPDVVPSSTESPLEKNKPKLQNTEETE